MKAKIDRYLTRTRFTTVIVLTLMLCVLMLGACWKNERLTFAQGTYRYTDEPFESIEGLTVDEMSINFTRIDSSHAVQSGDKNVAKSRLNGETFSVELYLKFTNEQTAKQYDVEFLPKYEDITDMYTIRLYLNNVENNLDYVLILRLWLHLSFNSAKGEIRAQEIEIQCLGREIGHIEDVQNDMIHFDSIEDLYSWGDKGVVKDVLLDATDYTMLYLEK